jgi:hypothetical protein
VLLRYLPGAADRLGAAVSLAAAAAVIGLAAFRVVGRLASRPTTIVRRVEG